jgi:apolipoprotein N-acyltransferase
MMSPFAAIPNRPLSLSHGLLFAVGAVGSFHLAYGFAACSWVIVLFLYCLLPLASLATGRLAFWVGMAIGLAAYAPHLAFFWTIFGRAAIALWCIMAFWLGLFLLVGRACLVRFGPVAWAAAAPFLWTGIEYFRSELYYLRFSWLCPGYAFSKSADLPYVAAFGTYGVGFMLMAWAAYVGVAARLSNVARIGVGLALTAVSTLPFWLPAPAQAAGKPMNVTGVQLEGAPVEQIKAALDAALKKHPQTDLFVLSEYAFFGPIPKEIVRWCKDHGKWLAAGGEDETSANQYYNSVFVVGPDGAIAFQQAKCVPVQFMKDGLPAVKQSVWDSPWGKLGFGICYDASYTRVTDELIRRGAQALIFPTMDNEDWGKAEHELHARIAPMRAAEYSVPVFRLCSSGISEFSGPNGRVISSAPFPGQGAMLNAQMELPLRGRMPLDRPLSELSISVTAALMLFLIIDAILAPRFK